MTQKLSRKQLAAIQAKVKKRGMSSSSIAKFPRGGEGGEPFPVKKSRKITELELIQMQREAGVRG